MSANRLIRCPRGVGGRGSLSCTSTNSPRSSLVRPTSSGVRAWRTPLVTSSEVSRATVSRSSVRCHRWKVSATNRRASLAATGSGSRTHIAWRPDTSLSARAGATRAGRGGARLALVPRRVRGGERRGRRRCLAAAGQYAGGDAGRGTGGETDQGGRPSAYLALFALQCQQGSGRTFLRLGACRRGVLPCSLDGCGARRDDVLHQPRARGVDGRSEPVAGGFHGRQHPGARLVEYGGYPCAGLVDVRSNRLARGRQVRGERGPGRTPGVGQALLA